MGYGAAALVVIKLVYQVFVMWFERSKERQKKKREMISEIEKELPNAIKTKDAGAITALFDDINAL